MKFNSEVLVMGMKSSKGEFEGNAYDSTKVYVEVAMDDSKETAKGSASAEYTMGTSAEFAKYKHLPFPFRGIGEFEVVTNGRTSKTVLHGIKPLDAVKPATNRAA